MAEENKNKNEEVIEETPVNKKDNIKESKPPKTEKKKAQHKTKTDPKNKKIKELESKLDEISDKHLRLQAEFDNFRKRTLKEKADLIKSAGESVLVNLLPVIDDFDRAIETISEVNEDDPSKQGIMLIFNKFKEFLKQNNIKEIDALEKEFDCEFHEAMTKIPAPTKELKGKNVDIIQKGYLLNDKVIRFAKVIVGE